MKWQKSATDLHYHPKVVASGHEGLCVWQFILARHGAIDGDGVLPARWVRPGYVAAGTLMSLKAAKAGLAACVREDLITLDGDGNVTLVGWDREWSSSTNGAAERQRKHRAKLKSERDNRDMSRVTSRNVTSLTTTSHTPEESKDLSARSALAPSPLVLASPSGSKRSDARARRPKPKTGLAGATPDELVAISNVLGRLSERSGRSYSPATEGHALPVLHALRRGFSEDDLRTVVWERANKWKDDEKMDEYLRPSTLFGKQKLPEYLAHAKAEWEASERPEPRAALPPSRLVAGLLGRGDS